MNAEAKKRYKDIDFPFTCPITHRVFKNSKGLSVFLTKTLKIDHSVYYDTYINHRDSSCFFCGNKGHFISVSKGYRNLCDDKECIKKSFNSHSVEGFMYRNMCSREEAKKLFEIENNRQLRERLKTQDNLRKKDPLWDKKRCKNCKEFWIEKGFTSNDADIKSKNSIREFIEKSAQTIRSNPEKYADKFPTKVEYYIKRGYSEQDAIKKIAEIQNRFSLEKCVQKYGKEEGERVWRDRQERWLNKLNSKSEEEKIEINRKKLFNNSGYSKVSQKLFWRIYDNFQKNDIRFEELNSEIIRYDKQNKIHYKYDYVDFTLKKCIEFNGDYWHCNPIKYNENFIHPISKTTAKEIWNKDNKKTEWMINQGYQVLTIWESEYRKNPQETLERCIDFINKK